MPTRTHAPTRPRTPSRVAALSAVVLLVTLAGCSPDDDGGARPGRSSAGDSPSGDSPSGVGAAGDFYVPPDPLPPGEPGDVIRHEPVAAGAGTRAWRVLYRSRAVDGRDIAVSGLVLAPDGPAPTGGRPVLAWAHPTSGLADRCAPSRQEGGVDRLVLGALVTRGFTVVATDYEGLGTPGRHPFLVGLSEGRGVLDSARAAGRLPEAGASSRVVVVGHSQGGGAALFAGELAPTYAPDLDLLGVVAAAPAAEVRLGTTADTLPALGYVVMAAHGFTAAYPDLPLDAVLTPAALDEFDTVENQCVTETLESHRGRSRASIVAGDPADDARWAEVLDENTAGGVATPAPVLLVHGDRDNVVPAAVSARALERMCAAGTPVARTVYPGADHTSVLVQAQGDLTAWADARLAGERAASDC